MTSTPVMSPPEHSPHEKSPVPNVVVDFFAVLRRIFKTAENQRAVEHGPDGVQHSGNWNIRVKVEPDTVDGGFVAEAVDLPGCMSQGETEEEALANLIDAVNGVVAVRMQERFEGIDFVRSAKEAGGREVTVSF